MASRIDKGDKEVMAIFAAPAVALLIWDFLSKAQAPRLLLNCYVLAATPLYLLVVQYSPFGSRWFWKAMTQCFFGADRRKEFFNTYSRYHRLFQP